MFWIYELPLWVLSTLCVGTLVIFNIAGVLIARKRDWVLGVEETAAAFAIHAFIGVVYAVALGLIVVSVQEGYDKVSSAVVREASAASDLFRTMEGVEEPERSHMQGLVERYVDRVITDEWPAEEHNEHSELTSRTVDSVARDIFIYEPRSTHAQLLYDQLLDDVQELLNARRERVYLGSASVGPVIWLVVIIGGIITLGFTWFFYIPSRRAHVITSGVAAALVGLMMFLILGLDHPAWGSLSVDPGAFITVQSNIDRWKAETASEKAVAPVAPLPKTVKTP
jgi:phosphate/sulfate permease